MACLDADSVQALLAGELVGPERARAEAHVDGCEECRQVLAALVRGAGADPALGPTASWPPGAAGPGVAMAETAPTAAPRPGRATVLPPGAMVGRYRIVATLGAGGMGVVYRADDPGLGRQVAVKLLRSDRAGASEERRLVREGQALARISHPNVIAVHDVGTAEGRVFVAMELVDGANLRAWLADRPRSLAEVLAVLAAAGRGLAAAHAAGLVHRDFKPDNVLVGRDGRVRVTDFGLARRELGAASADATAEREPRSAPPGSEGGVDAALTRDGALVGSPAYMAPEQHAGDHVDARSDQFGFCVTLFEALFGARPFTGADLDELVANVAAGRVAPPAAGGRVPAGLVAVVRRGLAVRPGDRFPTMDHLLAALGRSRARGLRIAAVVAAGLALAAGVGLAADLLARERQATFSRAGFAAQAAQLDAALAFKDESFRTLADAARGVGMVHDVMGNRDQADFGLGAAADDRARLAGLHDGLVSDEWLALVGQTSGGTLAVSDYKGRLLYTSAAPSAWATDVTALPAIARAMVPGVVYTGAMVRGDDPALLASGVTGGQPRPGWVLVFVRQFNAARAVQGAFVQVIDVADMLAGFRVGAGAVLAMIAPDGTATAPLPPPIARAASAASGETREVEVGAATWSVHATELRAFADGGAPPPAFARVVITRRLDAPGLVPAARRSFAAALAVCAAAAIGAFLWSRRSARLLGAVAASASTDGRRAT